MTRHEPSRIQILNEIFEHFCQMHQWGVKNPEHTLEDKVRAEQMIELLEVVDCGSCGGFDHANPIKDTCGYRLYDRFICVMNKYKSRKHINISFDEENTVESLGEYFKSLGWL